MRENFRVGVFRPARLFVLSALPAERLPGLFRLVASASELLKSPSCSMQGVQAALPVIALFG